MSFLYPRVISITRPNTDSAVGAQPYGGLQQANEISIVTGLPARIQIQKNGAWPVAKIPGDANGEGIYRIIFKAVNGLVQDRDIITDDIAKRYQVIQIEWGPLVTTCIAQIMET